MRGACNTNTTYPARTILTVFKLPRTNLESSKDPCLAQTRCILLEAHDTLSFSAQKLTGGDQTRPLDDIVCSRHAVSYTDETKPTGGAGGAIDARCALGIVRTCW